MELLSGTSAKVLEKVSFNSEIQITPGLPTVSVDRPNDYKASNTTYRFLINFVNNVEGPARVYLNFTEDWELYATNCTVWRGVVAYSNASLNNITFIYDRRD